MVAIYRNISLTFWTDIKVVDDFSPEDKYFMLYCLTNPHTNIIGCYEISLKQMSIEMGYTIEAIEAILKRFDEKHKILIYDKNTKELFIKNWYKYNWTKSPKILTPIVSSFSKIKSDKFKCLVGEIINEIYGEDTVSIPYRYPIDTTDTVSDTDTDTDSITDTEIEKMLENEQKKKKHNIDYQAYVDEYNSKCTNLPKVKVLTDKRRDSIRKFEKTFMLEQFREICDKANESNFLTGTNSRGWKADFDFLLRIDQATSILEGGKYANSIQSKQSNNEVLTGNPFHDYAKELVEQRETVEAKYTFVEDDK